ncbi:40S ribosomal protein S15-5 [Tritrichomonas foetus]|uniref:40S ribosomal protein S15-5 n=3 Tax=Tritrichomonas foetus TaxID=1144522 RepID=A0A1J4K8S2_9EUKA|nr:40S ribosomal protein S15-5 [Tritrichomonas foetus]OHT07611.1 40S ribosomal protein S15-5 [Tritrichomonas foetus]|eukprot:OHT06781.1 40S ribosomal protein S15-5 [Tritrichomonas foetus]
MSKFAQRNYTFRGKTLDDLKAMEIPEFVKLLSTQRRRFIAREFGVKHVHLIKKLKAARDAVKGPGERPAVVKTHLRSMVVLPEFVDNVIGIYNGKEFVEVQIKPEMIGHVLADFSMAKKIVKHSKAGVGATRSSSATSLK